MSYSPSRKQNNRANGRSLNQRKQVVSRSNRVLQTRRNSIKPPKTFKQLWLITRAYVISAERYSKQFLNDFFIPFIKESVWPGFKIYSYLAALVITILAWFALVILVNVFIALSQVLIFAWRLSVKLSLKFWPLLIQALKSLSQLTKKLIKTYSRQYIKKTSVVRSTACRPAVYQPVSRSVNRRTKSETKESLVQSLIKIWAPVFKNFAKRILRSSRDLSNRLIDRLSRSSYYNKSVSQFKKLIDQLEARLTLVPRPNQKVLVSLGSFLIIFSAAFWLINSGQTGQAASYGWTQSSWAGGATTTAARHSNLNDRSSWSYYESAAGLSLSGAGASLTASSASAIYTSDTNFATGTLNNTAVAGAGSSAAITLYGGVTAKIEMPRGGGSYFTCLLRNDGQVYCGGVNSKYQLGTTTPSYKLELTHVPGIGGAAYLDQVKDLAVGGDHACALRMNGTVYCWGNGTNGELGDGGSSNQASPVQVQGVGGIGILDNVISITAGNYHSCAIKNDGTVYCWGGNGDGQLGNATNATSSTPVKVKAVNQVDYLTDIKNISAGKNMTCAVSNGGTAYCWGYNGQGQLGINSTTAKNFPNIVKDEAGTGNLTGVISISAGQRSTCAVKDTGQADCWGYNSTGQLGNNGTSQKLIPTPVVSESGSGTLANVAIISISNSHACAINTSGNTYCWGSSSSGQVGDYTYNQRLYPVRVSNAPNQTAPYFGTASSISVGDMVTCALGNDKYVYCWGYLMSFGTGYYNMNMYYPVQVLGSEEEYISSVSTITGGQSHNCILANSQVYCWGSNNYGQIGMGNKSLTPGVVDPPYPVLGESATGTLTSVTAISSGAQSNFTCALMSDQTVDCWGENASGQIGIGTATPATVDSPAKVKSPDGNGYLTGITAISVGNSHACAIKNDSTAYCWGQSSYGALGNNATQHVVNGQTLQYWSLPVQVKDTGGTNNLTGVVKIAAGSNRTCAVLSDTKAYCWGMASYGTLGNGTQNPNVSIPVNVKDPAGTGHLSNVLDINVGAFTVCAVKTDGSSYCWGDGGAGQIGNNATTSVNMLPIQTLDVSGIGYLSSVTSIKTGNGHTCALKSDGSVYCCGDNSSGNCGDNATGIQRRIPVQVISESGGGTFSNGSSIHVVGTQSCATKNNGTAYCWGGNFSGGNSQSKAYPQAVLGRSYYMPWKTVYYTSSGDYTSGIIDVGGGLASYGRLDFNTTKPGGTDVMIQVAASDDGQTWDAFTGPAGTSTYYTASLPGGSFWPDSFNRRRYYKFKAYLTTNDVNVTPRLEDFTLSYHPAGWLVSSPYDSSSDGNLIAGYNWSGTQTGGSHVSFQIRSAPDNNGSPGSWTSWCGPDDGDHSTSTCSTTTFFTDHNGGQTIDDMFKDGFSDHWMQYRFFLESDNGLDAPTITSATLNYVVNMPPEITALSVAQQEGSGAINVNYSIIDSDTESGNLLPNGSRGYVSPSFDYSTDGGVFWQAVNMAYATITPLDANGEVKQPGTYNGNFGILNKVAQGTSTAYVLAWDMRSQLNGGEVYSTTTKIRLNLNDNEGANNHAASTSPAFTVDLKRPRVKVMIDSRSDAAQVLTFVNPDGINDLDNNLAGLQVKVINGTNLSVNDYNNWLDYASSTAILAQWSLTNTPVETVSFIMRDRFGNLSNQGQPISVSTPEKPSNVIYQDVSSIETNEWREFVAWNLSSLLPASFKNYLVYRSQDGGPFNLEATNIDINKNYLLNAGLNTNIVYHYKISVEDNDGNYSNYSAEVADRPDGQGGSDLTPPTISNVQIGTVGTTTTQSATISWDTDEPSNSTVKYKTTPGGDFSEATGVVVSVMADKDPWLGQHIVTLTGLSPNTTYYFQVESMDPSRNIGLSKPEPDGYSFSTIPGPIISGVTAPEISNFQAVVQWQTDIPATSQIFYSLNSNFTAQAATGSATMVLNHSITISNLLSGRTYYYYVQSMDGNNNQASDNNGGQYYSFHTTSDTAKPIISDPGVSLLSDKSAVISWLTDKPANSHLAYRIDGGEYTASTTLLNSNFNTTHSVNLINLTPNTKYYYYLDSTDQSGNVSDPFTADFTTMELLISSSTAQDLINEAYTNGQSNAHGSTIITVGNTDNIPPLVNSVNITEINTSTALVNWASSEPADSFVEYGPNNSYGFSAASRTTTVNHHQPLFNLQPDTLYYYRLNSADPAGNLSLPSVGTFRTISLGAVPPPETNPIEENPSSTTPEILLPPEATSSTSTLPTDQPTADLKFTDILQRTIDFIKNAAKTVSLAVLESSLIEQQKNLRELSSLTPAPQVSSGPTVKTWEDMAVISWQTDKETSSLVSFSEPGVSLNDQSRAQVVGNPDTLSDTHQVIISGLKPDTTYNYQLRGKTEIGSNLVVPPAQFKTLPRAAKVDNYLVDRISEDTASFKWVTSIPTDTSVRITPYRNNTLAPDEAQTVNDPKLVAIHEKSVNVFEPGIFYRIELFGRDGAGHILSQSIDTFSTTNQELPLLVQQVKTDSALTAGNPPQVQAIISWDTSRPATSKIYYRHGTGSDNNNWTNETPLDKNYTRRHLIVMTDFAPGEVYQFQVESTDSNGKTVRSQTHTILTPRQQESVFQLIMNNIEQTFGWLGAIRGQ